MAETVADIQPGSVSQPYLEVDYGEETPIEFAPSGFRRTSRSNSTKNEQETVYAQNFQAIAEGKLEVAQDTDEDEAGDFVNTYHS